MEPFYARFRSAAFLIVCASNRNSFPFASIPFGSEMQCMPVVRFQVFTQGVAQVMLFWVLTLCRIISMFRRFGCCSTRQYQVVTLKAEATYFCKTSVQTYSSVNFKNLHNIVWANDRCPETSLSLTVGWDVLQQYFIKI